MGNKLWTSDNKVRKKRWGDLGEPAINKIARFCASHSLLKTDGELSSSFESVFIGDYETLTPAARLEQQNALESLRQLQPDLLELRTQLIFEAEQQKAEAVVESDPGNHLYASLKRHPE